MSEKTKIYVGMDVHKDSVMVAVLPEAAPEPTVVKRLPNDLRKLRRFFDRVARDGEVRACYEASGAGYVLQRALAGWGHACEVVAPSLIPKRPGERRKHDRRDATDLARLYRAGELVTIRIPTAAEERVRDLVRCRETFQREILKSRHYVLKFLARRGLVYREGAELDGEALHVAEEPARGRASRGGGPDGLRRVPLAAGLQASAPRGAGPSDQGDRARAGVPGAGRMVVRVQGDPDARGDGAGVGDRRLPALRASRAAHGVPGAGAERALQRRASAVGSDHEGGQQPVPPRARTGGVELPAPAATRSTAPPATGGAAAGGGCAQLEGSTPAPQAVPATRVPQEQPHRGRRRGARARGLRVGRDAGSGGESRASGARGVAYP